LSEDQILQAGIAALKSGDKTRAMSLFAQLVKEHPNSERGWFLLGMSVTSAEQRDYCFQRVLTINPNNQDVKKQLALLSKPTPAPPPPAWVSQPAPRIEPLQQPKQTPISEEKSNPFPRFPLKTQKMISNNQGRRRLMLHRLSNLPPKRKNPNSLLKREV